MITKDIVVSAYNCLKSYAYYENLNFFLKEEIAQFEDSLYDEKIEKVVDFFENNNGINFNEWLNKIDVELLPKKIDSHLDIEQTSGVILPTNSGHGTK